MDIIKLNDMRFFGYHGVFPEETRNGQYFCVNAKMKLNTYPAGRSDDLEKSVSYADVFEDCKRIVEGEPYKLLEALAQGLAEQILQKYNLVEEVLIEVIKENPPIDGFSGTAAVEITRKQSRNVVYLALGTNMGDREGYLKNAISMLVENSCVEVSKVSSIYETKAVGLTNQADFLNQVIEVKTSLSKYKLLEFTQCVEYSQGRDRIIKWGPRTLDIDILMYNNEAIGDAKLWLPHPRIAERAFVLVPFAEIAPETRVPGTAQTVEDLLSKISAEEKIEVRFYKYGVTVIPAD